MNRRTFFAASAAAVTIKPGLTSAAPKMGDRAELLIVSGLGPDHPLMQSFVSQLLEQGIWFEFDVGQTLPSRLPDELRRYRAIVFDAPALEGALADEARRQALDQFARDGGFAFRLESPPRDDGLRPAVNSKLLLDLTTQHRVADIVAHASLRQRHPGLRAVQLARPSVQMLDELKQVLVGKLVSKQWSEYLLHQWQAARALVEAGHDDMRDKLADAIRRAVKDIPPPAHHDHIAAYFGAAWLAENFEERGPLGSATARLDEMLRRRPRTMGVASGYGFTDDPLRLEEVSQTGRDDSALMHTVMRRDTVWTEMLHMHAATLASFARANGEPKYRDELIRLIDHVRRFHLRPDGLLAHSTRDGRPIAPAWARGQSHALYGLLYALKELPADDAARPEIVAMLDEIGRGLIPHQDPESGLWRNVVDIPQARLESSGTTGIVCVYAHAVSKGWLPRKSYLPMLRNAWEGLRAVYWRGGLAANCRGTGASIEDSYYLGRPQGWAWMPQLIPAALAMQSLGEGEREG